MASGYYTTHSAPLCMWTRRATVHSGIMVMFVGPPIWQSAECAVSRTMRTMTLSRG